MSRKSSLLSFCFSCVAVLIFSSPAPASKLFKRALTYDAGGARSVVVGDVNGDGHPDILVANGGAVVLIGNGDGTFQPEVYYSPGGTQARSIAVADVNGDGKLDILLANECSNTCDQGGSVGVLLGNGDGTFAAAQKYELAGAAGLSIAVGDLNGDGKPDIAVTIDDQVGVLLNRGDGTFKAVVWYPSGGFDAQSVAIADLKGEGVPDLVVANVFPCASGCGPGGALGVLMGNGDGTFQPTKVLATNSQSDFVVVSDVNGDGKGDLLLAEDCVSPDNCEFGGVSVLLGNGDGTFQAEQDNSSGGFFATSLTVGDVNGDGKPDVIVVNWCNTKACRTKNSLGVLLGKGDGTLQPVQGYNAGVPANLPIAVALADVNGDGKLDAVSAAAEVGVLLGTSPVFTTTSLASSLNPSVSGQSVTFTATVACGDHFVPTGSVTFRNGTSILRTTTLSDGAGRFTTKRLPIGSLSLTASYNGSSTCNKSTSPVLVQIVNPK